MVDSSRSTLEDRYSAINVQGAVLDFCIPNDDAAPKFKRNDKPFKFGSTHRSDIQSLLDRVHVKPERNIGGMSETRYDWLADRWVIFAPHRSQRPDEFVTHYSTKIRNSGECPFCAGQEQHTPHSLLTLPRSSSRKKPWLVRVVPNKFPALESLPTLDTSDRSGSQSSFVQMAAMARSALHHSGRMGDTGTLVESIDPVPHPTEDIHSDDHPSNRYSLFARRKLLGAHEVIIETPEHLRSLTELSDSHTRLVFEAYRRRMVHWRAHDALHYAVIFKNVGPDAGASLSHSHSQLIATNFTPPDVLRSCQRLQQYARTNGVGYFEETIRQELAVGERVILETESFAVIAPFASQIPYFVWVLPKKPLARFEEIHPDHLTELSKVVRRVLRSLETLFPNAAYNFVLHTSPFDQCWDEAFHWRMEIFPRLTKVAGFEWGSDCYINPVLPEEAAQQLAKFV